MTDTLVRDHVGTAVRVGQVHIVLPAYNEEGSLRPLLERIDRLAASQPLTVWVIDDGSADRTAAVAARVPRVSMSTW